MMRRMTLLRRRPDVPREVFRAHWAGPHAVIAKNYPGLLKYTQNHVVQRLDAAAQDAYATDGMAELWFPDGDALKAASASGVTSQLIEDEPRFLDGVTGMILGDAALDDGSGGVKVIVLGRRRAGSQVLADVVDGMTYASTASVASTWHRETLWSLPTPPDTVVVARFVSLDAARDTVAKATWSPLAALEAWHAYHVDEVRVV